MRVIGGRFGGRTLSPVPGLGTRPTADRVRESLFNVLAPRIVDSCVLDLFSGTGALGIEAFSRGAARAVLVEHDAKALRTIGRNLQALDLTSSIQVLSLPVAGALPWLRRHGQRFDLVFMDPPYGRGLVPSTLALLAHQQLLTADGMVAVEHERHEPPPPELGWRTVRQLVFGATCVTLLREEVTV